MLYTYIKRYFRSSSKTIYVNMDISMTIYTYTMLLLNVCLLIDWCLCRHAEQDEPHSTAAVAEQAGPAALPGEAQDEGD